MISYKPLKKLLIDADTKLSQMVEDKIIDPNISAKFNKDKGYVTLATIDKVCNHLSQKLGRTVGIEEVIEFVADVPGEQ